jgi:hypothetical protein
MCVVASLLIFSFLWADEKVDIVPLAKLSSF